MGEGSARYVWGNWGTLDSGFVRISVGIRLMLASLLTSGHYSSWPDLLGNTCAVNECSNGGRGWANILYDRIVPPSNQYTHIPSMQALCDRPLNAVCGIWTLPYILHVSLAQVVRGFEFLSCVRQLGMWYSN